MRLLKRKLKKPHANGRIELERVIGLTSTSASGLASNSSTGEVAYLAGCVVVVYSTKTNSQTRFLVANRTPKAFSCVAYSYQGGKFVAAGESGHQPAVIIWDSISGQCMMELKTHKIGVACIEFSPNGKHLVSVGVPHDGFLCLWEWRSGTLLAKTRTSTVLSPVTSVHFASDGSFFLTAGARHLRQWCVTQGPRTRPATAGSATLEGKAINLGSQKDGCFVSIASFTAQSSDVHPIYVLSNAGILCLLHLGVAVEKWVDLKVRHGYDLAVSETHVACACSDGIVRFFVLGSLAYTATLPRPAPYGYHGLNDPAMANTLSLGRVQGINFPDAVACSFVAGDDRIAVVYADHSFYIWDIRDFSKISRCRTFLGHAGCVWDVTCVPQFHALKSKVGKENIIGAECFATCSADGSIRLWSVGPDKDLSHAVASKSTNVYCKEILGVIYIDGKDILKPTDDGDDSQDSSLGFRALSISSDGEFLASGDRCGNLRVYNLKTFELATFQEAHDAEILSLSFASRSDQSLLASGGRDRLVHVYDVKRNFEVVETLDDHSASITGVRFACNGSKLLTCSADKSVVFRQFEATEEGTKATRYHQEVAPRGTIYDMDVHPNEKFLVTAGQDKKVNVLNLATGKPVRNIKPENVGGEPIKVRVDPSGTFVICSHSDKCMRLYDFTSGEFLTHASGHAEVITGMAWLPDCKHLVSVSGDSCIFIWRLPPIMSRTMRRKLISQAESQPPPRYLKSTLKRSHIGRLSVRTAVQDSTSSIITTTGEKARGEKAEPEPELQPELQPEIKPEAKTKAIVAAASEDVPTFKFSVSKLPSWAQSKVEEETSESTRIDLSDENVQSAESRWVERVGNQGYKLATEAGEETPPATIHVSEFGARRRFSVEDSAINQDSTTPESSLNSQTDGSPMSSPREPSRRETQWKIVHTVFFDDMDFGDEAFDEQPKTLHHLQLPEKASGGEQEDGVVCLPEHEEEKQQQLELENASSSAISTPKKEVSFTTTSASNKLSDTENNSLEFRGGKENNSGSPFGGSNMSTGDDSDGCDESSRPCRGLFIAHFDKLSSATKVDSSARSSLSARYFARTRSASMQVQESLFDEDEILSANPGCMLAAERERLKLQERQDKMASEVQRMRERLVNLGLAVCENGKPEKTPSSRNFSSRNPPGSSLQAAGNDERITQKEEEQVEENNLDEGNNLNSDNDDNIKPAEVNNLNSDALEEARALDEPVCSTPRGLPQSEGEYIAALENLGKAAERAAELFSELQGMGEQHSSSEMARLTLSCRNVLPEALRKMQRLADQLSACGIMSLTTETKPKAPETPDTTETVSRPETACSMSELMNSSVDLEQLLERYSTRFSENLAHQVLALVQKGLGSGEGKRKASSQSNH